MITTTKNKGVVVSGWHNKVKREGKRITFTERNNRPEIVGSHDRLRYKRTWRKEEEEEKEYIGNRL